MSEVASLELSKELEALSGWKPEWSYVAYPGGAANGDEYSIFKTDSVPNLYLDDLEHFAAYDLGYLLRKLPNDIITDDDHVYLQTGIGMVNRWYCRYVDAAASTAGIEKQYADTPEDAACKLAIELFKQGVLKKEVVSAAK